MGPAPVRSASSIAYVGRKKKLFPFLSLAGIGDSVEVSVLRGGICGKPCAIMILSRRCFHVTSDQIAETIMTCPTGALHFERLDGGPQEAQVGTTTIDVRPNGPLYIRGHIRIEGPGGHVIREDTRVALCRCGHSNNKPFCDGTHRQIGFRTDPPSQPAQTP
jgi:CDGSH-type Zn-finger protein